MNFGDTRLPEAFWRKIRVNDDTGCWEWTASLDKDGYAHWQMPSAPEWGRRGHRISYAVFNGELIKGLQIDHLCRVRCCVNPDHLEQVTLRENVNRSTNYIAENRAKTHCPKGHAYEGENLVWARRKDGKARVCRTCRNADALARFYATQWNPDGRGAPGDRTHCPQGHEYNEVNTYIHISKKTGHPLRKCRACGRERHRERKARMVATV